MLATDYYNSSPAQRVFMVNRATFNIILEQNDKNKNQMDHGGVYVDEYDQFFNSLKTVPVAFCRQISNNTT